MTRDAAEARQLSIRVELDEARRRVRELIEELQAVDVIVSRYAEEDEPLWGAVLERERARVPNAPAGWSARRGR